MGKAPKFKQPAAETETEVLEVRKPSRLVPVLLAVIGLLLGGGGASAWFLFLAPQSSQQAEDGPEEPKGPPVPPEFVDINRLTIALVDPTGHLTGHMSLDLKFEVAVEDLDFVKARIPMMRHSINSTLSTTSIADKNNPMMLDYPLAQRVLRDAVNRALGRDAVRSVQIVRALPI